MTEGEIVIRSATAPPLHLPVMARLVRATHSGGGKITAWVPRTSRGMTEGEVGG